MGLLAFIKRFRGVNIDLFSIRCSAFDGYGISLLKIQVTWKGSMCTMANSGALLSLNFYHEYSNGGKSFNLNGGLLYRGGLLMKRVIIPEKALCNWCESLCETKEFYKDGDPYCSEYCLNVEV